MGGGPADGRYTKGLFRGSRLRLPYLVGTLRSRACSQFCVVAYQTRLFPVVVLACWNCRCLGSDDGSGQPASTCGQERLRSALAVSVWCPAIQRRSWCHQLPTPAFCCE